MGLEPGQNISKGIGMNFLPIEKEYIFLSFCLEVSQNKDLLDLSLSKSSFLGLEPLLNPSLPFWNLAKVWLFRNLRFITGRWAPTLLFTKNKLFRNSAGFDFTCWIVPFLNISFVSEFICNLSSWFTLANWGESYWNGVQGEIHFQALHNGQNIHVLN